MGTRNLTMVVIDGTIKVAQYGQWDGYPEGAGKTVFKFVKKIYNKKIDDFKEKVRNCRYLSNEELEAKYKKLDIDITDGLISFDDARKFAEHYPQLDRDMGANVLNFILDNGGCELMDNSDFMADSLFCEWAYLIDLDKEVLEVFGGMNESGKYTECRRFSSNKKDEYPVTCYSVTFEELSKMKIKEFVDNCY